MGIIDMLRPLQEHARGLAEFQRVLNSLPTPMAQKVAITEAYGARRITSEDAELLIQVYQLETA